MLTVQDLRDKGLIIFECITGSQAYGLSLPTSDVDIKGVFVLPETEFFGLEYTEQVNADNNNQVFYELKRFVELLAKNNPNLLEMLQVDADCVRYKHPLMERIQPALFLSRLCKDSFANYAMSQVKKARGLNKKIVNPMQEARKSILHFCQVVHGQGSKNLVDWLEMKGLEQERIGLVNIPNMKDMYGMFYDENGDLGYKGVIQKEVSTQVALSSVAKGAAPVGWLYFNKDGFTKYCKDYREYWDWVENRNEERYQNTVSHDKNYDAKNMMHTFRLLEMAAEILRDGKIQVRRPNREELLAIRAGKFEYEELLERAEAKMQEIEALCAESPLPERPDLAAIDALLVGLRRDFYRAMQPDGGIQPI